MKSQTCLEEANGSFLVDVDKIATVQIVKEVCTILLRDGKEFFSSATLTQLEEELPSYFVRIHRNCIVNGYLVKRIDSFTRTLVLLGNLTALCSCRKFPAVKKAILELNSEQGKILL